MLCLLISFHTKFTSPVNFIAPYCENTTYNPNSATGSIYRTNLNFMLDTLSSNASRTDTNGFYNFSTGNDPSNTVYGLFLCRGDLSADVCKGCVASASTRVLQECPNQKAAIVWYEECLLRFSDQTIFSKVDSTAGALMFDVQNVTGPGWYTFTRVDLYNAAYQAVGDASGKKFAVRENNLTTFQRLYTLTQCTPDLSADDCESCLSEAIGRLPTCCTIRVGGRVFLPSCNIRYELYRFYNSASPAPPPLSNLHSFTGVPPPSSTKVSVVENLLIPGFPNLPENVNSKSLVLMSFSSACCFHQSTPPFVEVPSIVSNSIPLHWSQSPYFLCLIAEKKQNLAIIALISLQSLPGSLKQDMAYAGRAIVMAFRIFLKRRSGKRYAAMAQQGATDGVAEILTAESLQYSLTEIQIATNNFSVDNKIGEGGFGRVYKGVLANGQEVAVKRLSRSSGQGAEEFKNEIVVVAKLQHRNLVRLLGFCLEGEEKILIYEFVPNRSLDYFLFDSEKKRSLNWSKRYKIIGGIARGLLYLHEDSRLRIIHRDLKASNILLDGNMSPKIADFGMAKICGVDQSVGNTNRIAGTFGYMAPEYTRCGQFSVKSDVFSFGVVILEIITGKKNSSFYVSEDSEGLLSYAWKHWRSGDPLALLDSSIGDSYIKNEVIQCVQVGLVCVEEDVSKRPTMASVVQMLNNSSVTLPTPHRPAVFRSHGSESRVDELNVDRSNSERISAPSSVNGASITEPYPR
ncbi:cysteine-rich receptor-like protein kinase 25 [Coffea eugenioides]|uniref:cysteine-rich receptor-like protein kinase 25 n=1 Tax=Coffea eugenioides TaxID=49369 RepID=UPI000F608B5E|nr:cysteine-rich receptor-like protein kinase 25 [Coffea eugenioides]